jgi:hypothetical protein
MCTNYSIRTKGYYNKEAPIIQHVRGVFLRSRFDTYDLVAHLCSFASRTVALCCDCFALRYEMYLISTTTTVSYFVAKQLRCTALRTTVSYFNGNNCVLFRCRQFCSYFVTNNCIAPHCEQLLCSFRTIILCFGAKNRVALRREQLCCISLQTTGLHCIDRNCISLRKIVLYCFTIAV